MSHAPVTRLGYLAEIMERVGGFLLILVKGLFDISLCATEFEIFNRVSVKSDSVTRTFKLARHGFSQYFPALLKG